MTVSLFQVNISSDIFTQWVVQDLLPKCPPRCVFIMDNATFHKSEVLKQAIKKAGHTLQYLPVYSPDLNPIEKKWAQAKQIRRAKQCNIETLFQHYNL